MRAYEFITEYKNDYTPDWNSLDGSGLIDGIVSSFSPPKNPTNNDSLLHSKYKIAWKYNSKGVYNSIPSYNKKHEESIKRIESYLTPQQKQSAVNILNKCQIDDAYVKQNVLGTIYAIMRNPKLAKRFLSMPWGDISRMALSTDSKNPYEPYAVLLLVANRVRIGNENGRDEDRETLEEEITVDQLTHAKTVVTKSAKAHGYNLFFTPHSIARINQRSETIEPHDLISIFYHIIENNVIPKAFQPVRGSSSESRVIDFTHNGVEGGLLIENTGRNTYVVETFMYGGYLTNGAKNDRELRMGKPPIYNAGNIDISWDDTLRKSSKLVNPNEVNVRTYDILSTYIQNVCNDFRKTVADYLYDKGKDITSADIAKTYNNLNTVLNELSKIGISTNVKLPNNTVETISSSVGNGRLALWYKSAIDNIQTELLSSVNQMIQSWTENYEAAYKLKGPLYNAAAQYYGTPKSSDPQLQQYIADNPSNLSGQKFKQYGSAAIKFAEQFNRVVSDLGLLSTDNIRQDTGLVNLNVKRAKTQSEVNKDIKNSTHEISKLLNGLVNDPSIGRNASNALEWLGMKNSVKGSERREVGQEIRNEISTVIDSPSLPPNTRDTVRKLYNVIRGKAAPL